MNKNAKIAAFLAVVFFLVFVLLTTQFRTPTEAHNQPLTASTVLTGHEVQNVTLAFAQNLTSNFRSASASGAILGEYFSTDAVKGILSQPGCVGIRIYYGKKTDGTPALVLVGVDQNDADISGGTICETGFPCPPWCDTSSPLEH